MGVTEVEKQYREYLAHRNSRWEFGNSILYKMCEDNPLHNEADVEIIALVIISMLSALYRCRITPANQPYFTDHYICLIMKRIIFTHFI